MAHGYSVNRRAITPGFHFVDPRTLILSSRPPAPLPPSPAGYILPSPVSGFQDLILQRSLFAWNSLSTRLPLDPSILIQMDEKRTQDLLQFMASEGLVPSLEEETKRKDVMEELKQIVLSWVRKVAWQRRLPKDIIAKTSATVLAYGSYGLGVHSSESDIDALCIVPYFTTIEDDFFIVLRGMLQSRSEVSELHCVKTAKVPLMRFKFNGVSIDFPYAQLRVGSVPPDVNIFDPSLVIPDDTSQKSLSGVRVNTRILQLVPNLKYFQAMLRCIKLWAKRRGIYSHLLGFFGGIHLAILSAYICQRYHTASLSSLITLFFETFCHWRWPDPVILQGQSIPFKLPDERCFMPILLPCSPFDWCNSNITRSTFRKIESEFRRGYEITKVLGRPDFEWYRLFDNFQYSESYHYFVRICLLSLDKDELQDWVGWVKSRFRGLLLKLEREHGFCDPNPKEYVDSSMDQPNTVFYWGLTHMGCPDINSIKEEFMKSINKEEYYSVAGTLSRLELSLIETSQLPKDVEINSTREIGSKAYWRIMDYYNHHRKLAYSHYLPHHFVGYVWTRGDLYTASFP
ncbi:hypothetical protein KSP40_PGU011942 [Platanthera guangdongensis]|uniref:polynucleotide adenylyltransferase n=1 Tax=Platanthera guangdongensis TaxID=2320717 RepID=A0ABR2LQB9_9ASPA